LLEVRGPRRQRTGGFLGLPAREIERRLAAQGRNAEGDQLDGLVGALVGGGGAMTLVERLRETVERRAVDRSTGQRHRQLVGLARIAAGGRPPGLPRPL